MQRYDIIKHLIRQYDFKSYLEIGVLGRETLNQIDVPVKHGVDPNGQGDFTMTSDEFFLKHCSQNYDIIFIDGLHLKEQVKKDIENALTHLNNNGIIIVHDCLPSCEEEQLREGISGRPWTGDVWKAFAELVLFSDDLDCCVVDTDHGCGIIKRSDKNFPSVRGSLDVPVRFNWSYFQHNRNALLNVITIEEFLHGHS